jgi:hypothetical protein
MSKKRPLPTVRMEPVFARDHQRRLRLVIDLLERAARQRQKYRSQTKPETRRAFTATHNRPGGNT